VASLKDFAKKVMFIFITIPSEIAWALVDFMLLMAFVWLTGSTVKAFLGQDVTRELVISYVGGIAICLSLASVLFSYARICDGDEKQKIVNSGRAILNGGIVLLLSFMLNYYQIRAADGHWATFQILFNYSRPFALVGSIYFAFVAGLELHRGFKALNGVIFH
jgi:hypothetical protein